MYVLTGHALDPTMIFSSLQFLNMRCLWGLPKNMLPASWLTDMAACRRAAWRVKGQQRDFENFLRYLDDYVILIKFKNLDLCSFW